MDDSKFDLIVKVCLEIANKSWEKIMLIIISYYINNSIWK